jgi:hypothetical protein
MEAQLGAETDDASNLLLGFSGIYNMFHSSGNDHVHTLLKAHKTMLEPPHDLNYSQVMAHKWRNFSLVK